MNVEELKSKANTIRKHILNMVYAAGSGHLGGALSAVELMTGLYFDQLNHNPEKPDWEGRDRVIFSKGHASALLYSCLAEAGYFPTASLPSYRKIGSRLQGHPSRNGLPGVEVSTGSLGQGLSIGLGMALASRHWDINNKVFVLIGDGECNCGQIWEAAMAAAHYRMGNLCAILDWNGLQIDGTTDEVMSLFPLEEKWRSFGWGTRVIDGHDFEQILPAYEYFRGASEHPFVLLAKTVKGKGVSFMENKAEWHGKAINKAQLEMALAELN